MKKLALLVTAAAALAVPSMANAAAPVGSYDATLTVNLTSTPYNHTYTVVVSCSTGEYTGTGNSTAGDTGPTGESVTGTIDGTASYSGTSTYSRSDSYSFSFLLASLDGGLNYSGMAAGLPATGTVSALDKAGQCTPPPAPKPTPKSMDDCKSGGFAKLYRTNGTTFKNQGDCVSYVANGK